MSPGSRGGASRLADLPELNVAFFAFLLNFVWEFLQVPFFRGMAEAPHWEAVQSCTLATVGDAGIALVAFWMVALAARSRSWVIHPTPRQLLGFVAMGVGITMAFEWLATEVLDRWSYAESMPTLPLLGTGLLPILQWIVLPPAIVWLVRRQLS
ncbi:MAG: hypothetical protein KY467_05360 [Gemmatimonadetes bacterium]|nr:hypothetical protein [Gemmatimonadota bacterium]